MLEVASEVIGMDQWPYRQARVNLRDQVGLDWKLSLFGSDTIEAIEEVARGDVHLATINPSSPLTMAYRGRGPFKEAIPVRAIAVIPTQDQFAFAVSEKPDSSLSPICLSAATLCAFHCAAKNVIRFTSSSKKCWRRPASRLTT